MIRAVVVGARRRRQGIGAFVARFLARAGVRIAGIVGSSAETAEEARRALCGEAGIESVRAYTNVAEALERERPRLTAICSPTALHREHLAAAAAAGTHCLCEKPLWWNEPPAGSSREAETARLADLFAEQKLLLELITQWPCTLSDFYRLHPEERDRPVESFRMLLSPISRGADMVLDSAPHPLSILYRLCGSGRVRDVEARFRSGGLDDLELRFTYRSRRRGEVSEVSATCRFRTRLTPPRPASYAINGKSVRREIVLPDYAMTFVDESAGSTASPASIAIDDPLQRLVTGFVGRVDEGVPTDRDALVEGIANLETLVNAARKAERNERIDGHDTRTEVGEET